MSGELVGTQNFSASEYNAHSSGSVVPDEYQSNAQTTLELLQRIRNILNTPIFITSGYRSPEHNTEIGGVNDSQHMVAGAADANVPMLSRHDVAAKLDGRDADFAPFGQLIYYLTDHHFHVGIGTKGQKLLCTSRSPDVYVPYSDASQIPQGFSDFVLVLIIALVALAVVVVAAHLSH